MTARLLPAALRRWLVKALLAVAVALLVVLVSHVPAFKLGIIERLELSTIDYRFQARGTSPGIRDSSDVVIVEISEDSFRSVPDRFPWPRSYYAHLARNLKAAGARAVGIDLIFSGPDGHAASNDEDLRRAIGETGIVVLAGKREEDNPGYVLTSTHEDFGNIFYPLDSAMGLVNIRSDADGVYRLYNPFYEVDKAGGASAVLPTFAFAVLNRYLGLPPGTAPVKCPGGFTYAGRFIPQYDPASLLTNFYGPSGTFRRARFPDVVDDSTFTTAEEASTGEEINTFSDPDYGYMHDGTFAGKIVLVGVTVPEYKDLFPVSVARGRQRGDNLMYGVEIHASIIENVLRNDFLRKESSQAETLEVILLTLMTFIVTSGLKSSKSRHPFLIELNGFLFVTAEILLIGYSAILLFNRENYVTAVIAPALAVVGGYGASIIYNFIAERKQRMLIKAMFSTYVNPSVVDELISDPEKLVLGGQRQELTVMFSDIEGFTTISEGLSPETLVSILNEYLSVMSDLIFRYNGTLDKYEGDAVMAFWGAPIPQQDHAFRACLCALKMQEALGEINALWRAQGKPVMKTRIGINTGEMVVGNMGAAGKFAYTVIGDSVNIASRLESANKEYHTGILVSRRTYDLVKDRILGRELDLISVRGRSEPIRIYGLIGTRDGPREPELNEFLVRYADALKTYRERKWVEAAALFDRALILRPDDRASQLHKARACAYAQDPPPDNWNGVFVMETK